MPRMRKWFFKGPHHSKNTIFVQKLLMKNFCLILFFCAKKRDTMFSGMGSMYLKTLNKLNFWTLLANLEYCGALNCPKTRLQIAFLFWKLMATLDRQEKKAKVSRSSTECPGKDKRCKLYSNRAGGPPREDSICRRRLAVAAKLLLST